MVDYDLFAQAMGLDIGVSRRENARLFELLSRRVPLVVHRFPSGAEHNGWVVPHDWRVQRAQIRHGGRTVFDGTCHPLAVAGYSSSFAGTIPKAELDAHVFHRKDFPDAYAFHSMYNYRPWQRHWGFCVPYAEYATWPDGDYEVRLETELAEGEMLVGEAFLPGESDRTVVFNAHTCHPRQANDDMAGVFALVDLFERLSRRRRHWSYLFVFAPEHVGTVFYTASLSEERLRSIRLGVFAEMLGTAGPLVLQRSFHGDSLVDRVARHVLGALEPDFGEGEFRSVVGNDETVWEAPGIEIPMISLSRWPYPEYHTSRDSLDIIRRDRLDAAVDALEAMVDVLEEDRVVTRRFTGLVALSNPRYGLYVERPDPVVDKGLSPEELRFGAMQDRLPRYFDGSRTIFDIAEEFDVDFSRLHDYLGRFEDKGLVALTRPSVLDRAPVPPRGAGRTDAFA
ncbi:aminopeptidase-like protein [Desulfobaculum xiamenense]|uniref:Aminopeptidase-like protein n=1 Tax=Desulfobaculum xiamenense TaxID=995050 RepID=A0A846QJ30_9BACT|nr:DUF4910 domain-containing protein [Desulfobaculum xiamenense]NJB67080.1 aminopeptidase-like protein [Desulfobaculum xiamenense]